ESINTLKVMGAILLFQVVSFGFFLLLGLQFRAYISSQLLNDYFNIFMHASSLGIILLFFKEKGISFQKVMGPLNILEERWNKWIVIKLLLMVCSYGFLLAILKLTLRFVSQEAFLEVLMEEGPSGGIIARPLMFVLSFTLAPIVEEVVFRGFLLNKWGEKIGIRKAIFWSSFLFSILHFQSFLPQFLGGLLYSLIYTKTGKLSISIILHSLGNFANGFLLFYLSNLEGETLTRETAMQSIGEIDRTLTIGTVVFIGTLLVTVFVLYKQSTELPQGIPYHRNN